MLLEIRKSPQQEILHDEEAVQVMATAIRLFCNK